MSFLKAKLKLRTDFFLDRAGFARCRLKSRSESPRVGLKQHAYR
ncbi:hypothetical protein SJ05684_c28280 [Sinorhizobium sojae CCBAU 05684]|uniref:Uncharacterized protein n=1 Tax=Sinorhizobium sojae CCBAU 05684 TaxID=716928 RepID=A0A249PG73_9HYPH|nr:hypothetical protein SJ05684_c28280 [Sinorhizobium sojae CCBAU 05684]